MNKNGEKVGRVIFKFIIGDDGQERLVRKKLFKIPKQQPVIGNIEFKNGTGEIVQKQGVVIHCMQQKNGTVSFKITDGVKTRKFAVPIENLEFFAVTQDFQQFKKRFFLKQGKLRSKR